MIGGFARQEEVFIKVLPFFWAAEQYTRNNKCEYIKYSASVENNDMQAYNKKGSTSSFIVEK
jgi:hypothetical protein